MQTSSSTTKAHPEFGHANRKYYTSKSYICKLIKHYKKNVDYWRKKMLFLVINRD
jgi:hypothetical protein